MVSSHFLFHGRETCSRIGLAALFFLQFGSGHLVAEKVPPVLVYQNPILLGEVDGSIQVVHPQDMILSRHTRINGSLILPGSPIIEYDDEKSDLKLRAGEGSKNRPLYLIQVRENATVRELITQVDPPEREIPFEEVPHFHFKRLQLKDGKVLTHSRKDGLTPPSQPGGRYVTRELSPGNYPGLLVHANGDVTLLPPEGKTVLSLMIDELEISGGATIRIRVPTRLQVRRFATISGKLGSAERAASLVVFGNKTDLVLSGSGELHCKQLHLPRGAVLLGSQAVLFSQRLLTDHLILTPGSRLVTRQL